MPKVSVNHAIYREELKQKICTTSLIGEVDFEGVDLFDNCRDRAVGA